jgi:hypothetical protein
MQMDQNSTALPANLHIHLDQRQNLLQIDLPTLDSIPNTPPNPADDFDLLGQPINPTNSRAGAIQNLHTGTQTLTLWPLPKRNKSQNTH